ncbi:MAG: serine hydrolase [Parasphingorhabdus sp.]|nr:serine hydrolase [Parasphingorhabdus sp.]
MLFALLTLVCVGCGAQPQQREIPAPTAEQLAFIVKDAPVSRERLYTAIAPLFDDPEMAETRALIVMKDGRIIAERYARPYHENTRFISWSMAKTITATLIGFLVSDGRLVLDDPAPVPAWQRPGDPRGLITLRQLLQMSSGLDHEETGEVEGRSIYDADTSKLLFLEGAGDMAAYAEARPLEAPPGSMFEYSTATSVILADIMTRVLTSSDDPTIRRDAAWRFMRGRLFEPMGMDSAYPEFDAHGTFIGGSIFSATARDYAKFGEFLRNRGARKGAQHLPVSWFAFMLKSSPNDAAYGAHVWLNQRRPEGRNPVLFPDIGPPGIFAALGHLGQYVIVSPRQRLTIVRLGKTQDDKEQAVTQQLGKIVELFPLS